MGTFAIGIALMALIFGGGGGKSKSKPPPLVPPAPPDDEPDEPDDADDANDADDADKPDDAPSPEDLPSVDELAAACCYLHDADASLKPDALLAAALTALMVPGPWPPSPNQSQWQWAIWTDAIEIAKGVLSGAIACEDYIVDDVHDTPTAGGWYRIKKDDTLYGIVTAAYGTKPGTLRMFQARAVNEHPLNRGLWVDSVGGNITQIGKKMISFYAKWRESPGTTAQRYESGSSYAVVWLPEKV